MNMSDHKFRAWKEELIARAHAATTKSNEDAALTKETLDDPQKALAYAFTKHWPEYPLGDRSKVQVSICLSADVLDYYLSGGPGWQNHIEETLREAIGLKSERNESPS
jgi:uncharacterized protein (DUF4415 family)